MNRKLFLIAQVVLLALIGGAVVVSARPFNANTDSKNSTAPVQPASKITAELRQQFSSNPNAKIRYLVALIEQADTSNNITDWNAKGQYVLDTLRDTANRTQPPVTAFLNSQQQSGNVDRFKSYYIINGFEVVGNLASAEAVAALPEVATVADYPIATVDSKESAPAPAPSSPNAVEWHVSLVRAPQAWALTCGANPCNGKDIPVGIIDTGVRWTHNALKPQYRGWDGAAANHNYNWWDSRGGTRSAEPIDDDGHGTHVLGIFVGDDSTGNQIGVAPGAKWIASNGIASGGNEIEAGEFMLAPWDLNHMTPTVALRPRVVSNSWGDGTSSFNCTGATFFYTITTNWINAGIFASFSAGNDDQLGNRVPAAYAETFETGSLTTTNVKSSWSAIGPSCHDNGQHPQILAGGGEFSDILTNRLRSSVKTADNAYDYMEGTSQSQPATAGAVAIIVQANPGLTVAQIKQLLIDTAYWNPVWGDRPNTHYGHGLLQVDAAVQRALQLAGGTHTPTRTATPTPCAITKLLIEGFDSGSLGLFTSSVVTATTTPTGTVTPTGWSAVTNYKRTGSHSAFAPNVNYISDQRLTTSNPITIPAGLQRATLTFWHSYYFEFLREAAGSNRFIAPDGGVLEVSTDSGTNWNDAGANITLGGYIGNIQNDAAKGNPLRGRQGWVSYSGTDPNTTLSKRTFLPVVVNLLPYAGQSLLFRFRLGTDDGDRGPRRLPGPPEGWWIDDIEVTLEQCGTACPITWNGLIAPGDRTQSGRLILNDPASVCGTSKPCPSPTLTTTSLRYRTYTFTHPTGSPTCVTVQLTNGCGNKVSSAAYLGSYNPSNLCTNYIADAGTTGSDVSYSFNVANGATYVVVVFEVDTTGCSNYTLKVYNGCNAPPTNTPTPTSTPGACGSGWTGGPNLPSPHVRPVGVWYPSLGRFYVMGGRAADPAGNDIVNPRYYDPVANSWTVDTATFPDNQVNNMICADLNGPSGHRIYCVGGSAAGGSTTTGRVAVFDPVAHTITTLATDPWPAVSPSNYVLPGGFAVHNNKLYILGGFVAFGTVNMSRQIWEFDPNGTAGSRWTLKSAQVPDPSGVSTGMGYIPAATVGSFIYTAGGSQFDGVSTILDSPLSFRYDPVADVVSDAAVPDLPAPGSGETRALNVGGKVWLIGGGRTAPNPSSNVLEFDPANPGLGWQAVSAFTGGRRNFAVDIDPATGKIYLAGGYMPTTPTDTMQIFTPGSICTPTRTSTPTGTITPTITPTPVCPGSWVQMAAYPSNALDEAIAVQGGILYSFSGVVNGSISPLSYKYDPGTNTWTQIASLPSGRENASAVSDGTHIYIMGGNDSAGNVTSTLWRYDPGANTYITLTAATTATRAQAAAYHNGRIYKFGGLTAASATNALEIYNIAGGTWSAGAVYPQSVGFHAATALGGFVYGAGGTSSGGIETLKTYRYDPVGNSWDDAAIADLPETRWGSASDVLKGKWLLAGGFVDGNFSWTSTRWNSVSNAWEHVDLMAAPRARLAGGTIGTAFYAVAGGDPTTPGFFDGSNNNQRYVNTCQNVNLVGHVVWQLIPQNDARSARPITLTLKLGPTEVNYPQQNTDNSGYFTVSVSGLPNGTYNWRVQGPDGPSGGNTVAGFLANCGTIALTGAAQTNMENSQVFGGANGCTTAPGCIRGGDGTNDNIVNISDFNLLKTEFNQAGVRRSDYNNDLIVSINDFNILKSTFNQAGCPAVLTP